MAAWCPVVSVPLLRGSRGVSGGVRVCFPRERCRGTWGRRLSGREDAAREDAGRTGAAESRSPIHSSLPSSLGRRGRGCGAMYEIKIESEEFKEKRTVQQHQMVNQALKEEIKGMHGLRIFTSIPKC
ncbi:PREDICTED: bolA-like protein 3 [Dipodomys ordii]|uniref:BolA-like protein 3 n=1 Tax=Dipodomys ordii TaxID=10020 RepID=A0A1S3GQ11_DIPOR|nr:PREDICTED: bolA-like protein 3 [Dipodomys ordii]